MCCVARGVRTWRVRWLLALAVLGVASNIAWGQTPTIVRVEEDWEMVVATPDMGSDSPQVTCVISPSGNVDSLYAAFELNHRSLPSYAPGGLQLQVWNGETALVAHSGPNGALLNTSGERVTWTQGMTVSGGSVVFEIRNGASSTWGTFGGWGYLQAVASAGVSNLNGYQPDVSVKNSGVGFAGNRVQSLVLKQVRYFTSDGQRLVDTTVRTVHTQP